MTTIFSFEVKSFRKFTRCFKNMIEKYFKNDFSELNVIRFS